VEGYPPAINTNLNLFNMDNLIAKPKAKKGRPLKNLNPSKAFEWFDETEYARAVQDHKVWEELYSEVKVVTKTDFETIDEFEANLRSKYPELAKLDIEQLYILAGLERVAITDVFRRLQAKSKPSLEKSVYTVKIPSEKANEYSQYLSIAQAFNNLREAGNNQLNTSLIPQITGNRIVLDSRSMKLIPNAYRFTQGFK
jgi:hypothetical protein